MEHDQDLLELVNAEFDSPGARGSTAPQYAAEFVQADPVPEEPADEEHVLEEPEAGDGHYVPTSRRQEPEIARGVKKSRKKNKTQTH